MTKGDPWVIQGYLWVIQGYPLLTKGDPLVGLGNKGNLNTVEGKGSSGFLGNWGDGNWLIFTFENLFTNGFDKILASYKFARDEDGGNTRFSVN